MLLGIVTETTRLVRIVHRLSQEELSTRAALNK